MPELVPLDYGRIVRPSIAHNIDKINEVIDWINNSEIKSSRLVESGEGEIVQVGNATQLAYLDVHGKSAQDGTPTPENPVPVQVMGGVNLLVKQSRTGTINGITYSVSENGEISANGTATSLALYTGTDLLILEPGTYTLSGCPSGGGDSTYRIDLRNAGNTLVFPNVLDTGNGVTFTVQTATEIRLGIRIPSGYTANNVIFRPQLVRGSSVIPYLPYGCIGLNIDGELTPIDLQGHTLAGLQNNVRDELTINAAGVKAIGRNIYVWNMRDYADNAYWYKSNNAINGFYLPINQITPKPATAQAGNIVCNCATGRDTTAEYFNTPNSCYVDSNFNFNLDASVVGSSIADFKTWLANHDLIVYARLATPTTIALDPITPPAIPDNAVISISASLTPTFDAGWFTEDALPMIVNDFAHALHDLDLRVDALEQAEGTTTTNIVRPSITIDRDIKTDQEEPAEVAEPTIEPESEV